MILRIRRTTRVQSATIGTATSSATAVRLDDAAGAVLFVGPLTASAAVTIYGGGVDDPAVLVDGGSVQTLTLAASTSSSSYALPDALFGTRYVRLVASSEIPCRVVVKT